MKQIKMYFPNVQKHFVNREDHFRNECNYKHPYVFHSSNVKVSPNAKSCINTRF